MPVLTEAQLAEIRQLIDDYHAAFFVNVVGGSALIEKKVRDRLIGLGLISPTTQFLPKDAFLFGIMLGEVERKLRDERLSASEAEKVRDRLKKMSYDEFKGLLKKHPEPTTDLEKNALAHVQRTVYTHLKGLGNTIDEHTNQVVIEGDQQLRRKLEQTVQRKLIEGIESRKTISQIGTMMGQATEQYARDWYRISATETNNAFSEGQVQQIIERNEGKPHDEIMVYKRPSPGACDECVKAYLKPDGTPRLFSLSEITENGTNVGKKRSGRKPVVTSHHPWCFAPGALVTTARGLVPIEAVTTSDLVLTHKGRWRRVVQLHENQWSGVLLDVNGTKVTPNHPYLTARGWVPAEALQDFDYLVGAPGQITGFESDDGPAFGFEISGFDTIHPLFSFRLVPASSVDLHREFALQVAKIDVESLNREQRGQRKLVCPECGKERGFKIGEGLMVLHGLGFFNKFTDWSGTAPPSFIGFADKLLSFFRRHLGLSDVHGLAAVSAGYPERGHVLGDSFSWGFQNFGHLQDRESVFDVKFAKNLFGQIFSRWSSSHVPIVGNHAKLVNYTSGKRSYHSGKVYNLSVWGDESFVVDGLVVHNCRCQLYELPPGSGFDKEGNEIYVGIDE